jgi:hypothetical protein
MSVKIAKIESILFDTHKGPATTRVMAEGQVNTGGWSDIKLVKTPNPPKDLRVHIDFVGTKPTGIVTQAFVKVKASLEIEKVGKKGVTIHAASSELSKDF